MQLNRRGLLSGLLCAPVIIRTPGLLMPIKPLSQPLKLTYLIYCRWSVTLSDVEMPEDVEMSEIEETWLKTNIPEY